MPGRPTCPRRGPIAGRSATPTRAGPRPPGGDPMPAPTHPVELLDWLQRHQFLTPEQAAELRPLLPTFPDVRLLARELIQRNWLTPYQVNQVLQGKGEQLILGWLRLCERL